MAITAGETVNWVAHSTSLGTYYQILSTRLFLNILFPFLTAKFKVGCIVLALPIRASFKVNQWLRCIYKTLPNEMYARLQQLAKAQNHSIGTGNRYVEEGLTSFISIAEGCLTDILAGNPSPSPGASG